MGKKPTIDIFDTQPKWFTDNREMIVQRVLFIYFVALEEFIERMTNRDLKWHLKQALTDPHSDEQEFYFDPVDVPVISEAFIPMIEAELDARK
jgi:hypothetical protein